MTRMNRLRSWLEPDGPASRLPAWSIALVVFGVSFLVLELCVRQTPLQEDTARDLLIARDCVDAGRCAMAGPTASFGGLTQGGLWIHVLEMSRAAGLGLHGIRGIVLGLLSVACVLVAFAPRRLLGWPAGPAAWAIALAATASTIELPTLWNPSVLPLPLVLFYLALLGLAADGGLLLAAAAGVALSLAVDAHVVCIVLVPLALTVVVTTAGRPILATLVAVVLAAITTLLSSAGAVTSDLPVLAAAWLPSSAVMALALTLGVVARGRARTASARVRVRAVLVGACGYVFAALVLASVVTHRPLQARYLAPIVPLGAILAAGVAVGALRRRPVDGRWAMMCNVAVGLAVVVIVLVARSPGETPLWWTATDAEALAPALAARGWTFSDLFQHQRGPQAHPLLAALAPFLPPPDAARRSEEQDDLLLLKATRSRVHDLDADRWIVASLPGTAVAVGRRAPSWLDASSLEVCAGPPGSDVRCVRTSLSKDDPDRGLTGTFSQRAYPELETARQAFLGGQGRLVGPFHWALAVRLQPSADGPAHTLTLPDRDPPWTIERIEGAAYEGSLPAREVTLEKVTGEGRIVFAVDVSAEDAGRFRSCMPSIVETTADEVALRALSVADPGASR